MLITAWWMFGGFGGYTEEHAEFLGAEDDSFLVGNVSLLASLEDFDDCLDRHRDDTGLPVVVDFYSNSCGPCRQIAPIFRALAKEFKGRAVFAKVNTNKNYQTSAKCGVRALPTFQFYQDGKKVYQFSGADGNHLRQTVQRLARDAEKRGTYVNVDVTEKQLEEFYARHSHQVGSKADPASVAIRYQGKTAKLMRHLHSKYGEVPSTEQRQRHARPKPQARQQASSPRAQQPELEPEPEYETDSFEAGSPVMGGSRSALVSVATSELEAELQLRRSKDIEEIWWEGFEESVVAERVEQVVVVGGGPAGLAAAIYASRAGLSPVVVAPSGGGQLLEKGVGVENYPGITGDSTSGRDVVSLMRIQARGFDARLLKDVAEHVDLGTRPFEITLKEHSGSLRANALIVATGASTLWLDVPGEAELRGRGVSACATCDGFLFRGQRLVVIGGGDTAMEDALVLARVAEQVTVIHRRDTFRASHILAQRVLGHDKIVIKWNSIVTHFVADSFGDLSAVGIRSSNASLTDSTELLSATGAFVAIGQTPNTDLFRSQLDMDEQGYIEAADGSTRTNVPGVFVAGDVSDKVYRQAVTSAGMGAMAALDAERWLSTRMQH